MSAPPLAGKLNEARYAEIVAAFRAHHGQIAIVARMLGVSRKTAARAWHHGWNSDPRYHYARPVRDVLAAETLDRQRRSIIETVSGRVLSESESETGKQRADRKRAEDEESRAINMARRDTLGAALAVFKALPAVSTAAARLSEPGALDTLEPAEVIKMLATYSLAVQRIATAVETVVRAGKAARGEPTEAGGYASMSEELAAEELEAAHAFVEQFRAGASGYVGERVVTMAADGSVLDAGEDLSPLPEDDGA